MDLGFLTLPLMTALSLFGLAVFTDPQTVYLSKISVPPVLEGQGYTGAVVTDRLAQEVRAIETRARSRSETQNIAVETEETGADLLADYFSMKPLIRAMQTLVGTVEINLSADIIADSQNQLLFTLRGTHRDGSSIFVRKQGPADRPEDLFRTVALDIVKIANPYLFTVHHFKTELPTGQFPTTKAGIQEHLRTASGKDRLWLINLAAIVSYLEGRADEALARFDAALAIEPDFSLPLLNQGIVLARQGRHVEAIDKYAALFLQRQLPSDAAGTYAAALSEWGMSLAVLGRHDEAADLFQSATQVDPGFADVYFNWALMLQSTGRADEAAAKFQRGEELAPTEHIYAENLISALESLEGSGRRIQ